MTSMFDIVRRFLAFWSVQDPVLRRAEIEALFDPDCSFTNPDIVVRGIAPLEGFVGAVQKRLAGVTFVLVGEVDAHHDVGRFTWHAMAPGRADPVASGFDVIITESGRIKQVIVFVDKVSTS